MLAETVAEALKRPLYSISVGELGTNPDINTVNANNRVQVALSKLPSEVKQQGVTVKKKSTSILVFAAVTSTNPAHDPVFMSNYVDLNVLDEMKRIPGVGEASI